MSAMRETANRAVENAEGLPPGRWNALACIALAQAGAMSTWFSTTAVGPSLAQAWAITPTQVGLLTVAVQFGFVVGASIAAVIGIADVLGTRRVFVFSALLASLANVGLTLAAGDFRLAVALRCALG